MKQSIDNQIKAALTERTLSYSLWGDGVVPLPTAEADLVQQLWQARQLATRLTRSTVDQFSLSHKAAGVQMQLTDLGKEMLHLLQTPVSAAAQMHYPNHQFDPRVQLFLECMDRRNLSHLWQFGHPSAGPELMHFVDTLNGFAQDVRKRATTNSFKAKVLGFHAEIDKRHKELKEYFEQLGAIYPVGHLIRMDFSYRPGQPLGQSPGKEMYQQVRIHCEAMLSSMKGSLGSALAGYAWKRDYAMARGYQYHLVAVLNGPQLQELDNIIDSLGQDWCRNITGGMGLFFNCHAGRGHDFQYRGLVPLNRYSASLQEQLRLAPVFMALTDGLFAFAPIGKDKLHGMGTLPKVARPIKTRPMLESPKINGVSSAPWPFSIGGPTGLL